MTRPGTGALLSLLVLGLVLAALCLGGALLVMGMGHGWGWPMRHALLPFLFYPLALGLLWVAARVRPGRRWLVAVAGGLLLAVGIGLDLSAWVGFNGTTDRAGSARAYPEMLVPWLVFWLGWQVAAGAAVWRGLRSRVGPRVLLPTGLAGLAAIVAAIASAPGFLDKRGPSATDVATAVRRDIGTEFLMISLGQGVDPSAFEALVGPEGSRVGVSDVACAQGGDAWTCTFVFEARAPSGEVVVPARPMVQDLWRPDGYWTVRDPQYRPL